MLTPDWFVPNMKNQRTTYGKIYPMKIVLVFPPFCYEPMYNLPPLGIINVATAVRAPQHEIALMDFVLAIRQNRLKMGPDIYETCAERILGKSPDVVGFSAQCTTYPAVIQISRIIKKKRSDIKIVLGGHNASFVDKETLTRYPFVDAVVRGEGEVTFRELIAAYERGSERLDISGVSYRLGDRVIRNRDRELIACLDDLPLPDYGLLPSFSEYREACALPRQIAILEVGRGCPHHCIYCSESILWRRRIRTYSVHRLVREMETLHHQFGVDCFTLAHDQFTAQRKFVESFCHLVIEKKLHHIPWYCISRLDSVDSPLLRLMREAGCESMCYGIDSGSERTLAFIRKKIDKDILYRRVKETAEQGLIPTLSFVIGFPEEDRRDIDETLKLALQTGIIGNNNPLIQIPTVLPGTDLHHRYRDRLIREIDTYFSFGLEFEKGKRMAADDALIDSDPIIYSSFYNVPCRGRSLKELNRIATYFPLMVQLYPKTFMLLSIECSEPVSDLFLRWLGWLKVRLFKAAPGMSARECYVHFTDFVQERLEKNKYAIRPHLKDLLAYETRAIETAEKATPKTPFCLEPNALSTMRPRKNQNFLMKAFDFNIPMIILDLKAGIFDKVYPSQKTLLIFRQEDSTLEVSEINRFTKDFLEECTGKKTLDEICEDLYALHGREMEENEFFKGCAEALKVLGEGGFLTHYQT